MGRLRSTFTVAFAGLVMAAACSSGGSSTSSTTATGGSQPSSGSSNGSSGSSTSVGPRDVRLRVERVASGLATPVAFAVRRGDDGFYVAEQHTGLVRRVATGGAIATVLDLGANVSTGSEQGLLGLAFSLDGSKLYVDYTDTKGDTHIVEYAMRADTALASSARELLFVDQPYPNHNGGQLVVDRTGMLDIALGDGGSAGDPQNRAQDLGVLLGKILRVDPRPAGGRPYTIPPDNPFVRTPGARPEVWQCGLRNPWRFSFDRATNDLWIGDVGQSDWEEIDHVAAGRSGVNFGWSAREGTHRFKGSRPRGAVDPVYEYSHDGGRCAVIGGFVYRGRAIPGLAGTYLFTDYCDGVLQLLGPSGDHHQQNLHLPGLPTSFGQDAAGELYLLTTDGSLLRLVAG